MQETRQPKVLREIKHYFVTVEEEDDQGRYVPRVVVKAPESIEQYAVLALDLWEEAEARRCVARDLSEGELSCLKGITQGLARATSASQNEPRD